MDHNEVNIVLFSIAIMIYVPLSFFLYYRHQVTLKKLRKSRFFFLEYIINPIIALTLPLCGIFLPIWLSVYLNAIEQTYSHNLALMFFGAAIQVLASITALYHSKTI
jgi:hypothetical protein